MTVARGDVRSAVTFEGTDTSAAGLQRVEERLRAIAASGDRTAKSVSSVERAFTGVRGAAMGVQQVYGTVMMVAGQYRRILGMEARLLGEIIEHDRELSAASQQLNRDMERLATSFSGGVREGGHLLDTIRGLDQVANSLTDTSSAAGYALDQLFAPERLREFASNWAAMMNGNPLLATVLGYALEYGAERLQSGAVGTAGLERIQNEADFGTSPDTSARDAIRAARERERELRGQQRRSRRGGGGGGGRNQEAEAREARREAEAMIEESERLLDEWEQQSIAEAEFMADATETLFRAQEELAQQRIDKVAEVHEAEVAAHEARLAMMEAEAEAHNSLTEKAREDERARNESMMRNLDGFAQATDGIAGIFDRIADSEEERGRKSDGWRKAQGVAKGILYQLEAVAAGAQAAMDIAESNYGGAAAAIVAAAGYEAASIMAFRDLAQSSGGGGGARVSAGSYVPTTPSRVSSASDRSDERPERVTVIGLGTTDADVAASIVRANYSLLRSGRAPLTPGSGVGYQG